MMAEVGEQSSSLGWAGRGRLRDAFRPDRIVFHPWQQAAWDLQDFQDRTGREEDATAKHCIEKAAGFDEAAGAFLAGNAAGGEGGG